LQILIEEQTPWETLLPLAQHSFLPFRDAAQGAADHGISIQDIVWGVWKAKNYGLVNGDGVDAEAYEVSWFRMRIV
jgi:cell division cycle 14